MYAVPVLMVTALAGCAGSSGAAGGDPSKAVWGVSPVVSSTAGTCTAAPSPTVACSLDGRTTYQLGPGLSGHIVSKATTIQGIAAQGDANVVDLRLVPSAVKGLADLTTAAAQSDPKGSLAFLLEGRVILAAQVSGPVTDGQVQLAGFTNSQAKAVVAGRLPSS